MKTVKEVSRLTGVSIRALQYYDKIGLLKPAAYTEAGYRLYDAAELEKLQQILLFRELEFPLQEIKQMITSPEFDRQKALTQQIALLTMKKERLESLIQFARGIQLTGGRNMDFSAFDTSKIEEYTKRAKEQWGTTDAYKEFEEKSRYRSKGEEQNVMDAFRKVFEEFGVLKGKKPEDVEVQEQVKKLQNFITNHFYTCSDEILFSLGQMYAGGGEFTENIDKFGGAGTAVFTAEAITLYCKK